MNSEVIIPEDLSSSGSSRSSSIFNNNDAKEYKLQILWPIHKQAMRYVHGVFDRRRCFRGLSSVEYFFSMESNIDEKHSRFKIYLNLEIPENKSITAEYHIRVPSAGYSKYCRHFFAKSGKKGDEVFNRYHVFETKNKYIEIASIKIKIDGIFKVKESTSIVPFFINFDYCIFVDGQKIQVHKSVIQQNLPNFYLTFNSQRGKHRVTNFSFMVVKAAAAFCYNQPISPPFFSGILFELIKFAETFESEKLKGMAESELCKKITIGNVIEYANFTDLHILPTLRKQTLEFLALNYIEKTVELKALNSPIKLEMAKLCSDN